MTPPEFSRPVRLDTLGTEPRAMQVEAEAAERAALRRRFGLLSLDGLRASLTVTRSGDDAIVTGRLTAEAVQACIASGEPVSAQIDEAFSVRFRPDTGGGEDEIELGGDELDTIFYDGAAIDVGEAVAQTLALALDPYPRAGDTSAALSEAGVKSEGEAGPFGGLAVLRDKLGR